MATLDAALAAARSQLLRAREELAQRPARSFQDAFLDALRGVYEAAAPATTGTRSKWRRADLRHFLGTYFPVYEQETEAFAALCACLSSAEQSRREEPARGGNATSTDEKEEEQDPEHVLVDFDELKHALERQFASTRLAAKAPFPLEPRVEPKYTDRRASVAPLAIGGGTTDAALPPELLEFQADVLKKSQSWLGRWRARHLVLRWGTLELHKRSLAARASFRHGLSSSSSSNTVTSTTASNAGDGDSISTPTGSSHPASSTKTTKTYALRDLVSLQLEQLSDSESNSARKAALTLQFQTPLALSANSHSNANTSSHEIKTVVLGGGGSEASDVLAMVRARVATFALFLELSRHDCPPSVTKVRRFLAAGAQVNVRSRIPRQASPREPRESRETELRYRRTSGLAPHGALTALQLAFLQDPRGSGFESILALLLHAGADPSSLLHWDYATQVFFPPASAKAAESTSASTAIGMDGGARDNEEQQLQRRRRELLLRDKIGGGESEGDVAAVFSCGEVQADDSARWNLLMYFCWQGDFEGVQRILATAGPAGGKGHQGSLPSRQQLRCLDHVNAAGDTALHVAIKASSEPVALLLVEAALSTNAQAVHRCDARGEPVAHLALTVKQWRVVDALVAGGAVDPRSYDALGNTALHLAIQVRAPVALVARLIQVYRRAPPSGGLESRAGRRGGNDTPLSLALKGGQQEIVALLLAAGASPAVTACQWGAAFSDKREGQEGPNIGGRGVVGEADSALHVAIKAGLDLAAAALIAHGADVSAVDSQGASPLALAVRYGLYALAATLAEQLQCQQKTQRQNSSKPWWVDGETGRPVSMLAVQAGQLELAAFLLDRCNNGVDVGSHTSAMRLLPLLIQVNSWLGSRIQGREDASRSGTPQSRSAYEEGKTETVKDTRLSSSGSSSSSATWTRDRVKSRSDGDWRHLRLEAARIKGGIVKASVPHEELESANAQTGPKTQEDTSACVFLLRGIHALVLQLLQISEKTPVGEVLGTAATTASVSLATLPLVVHLPATTATATVQPATLKDDELTAGSPLHVAASGGLATAGLLRLLLSFLLNADASAAAPLLVQTMGSHSETLLHAALTVGAAENALLLLYTSRELQARGTEASSICVQLYESPTSRGDSPLHLASVFPRNPAMRLVVELLLQEQVYAGGWNGDGLAPLHVALHHDCDDAFIELFLRYGQDLNLWTEGSRFEDEQAGSDTSDFFASGASGTSPMTLVASCPQTPLMLAVEFENAVAFRALVRGGAQARVLMPRARVGLLQLALHCDTRDPELLACLLDNADLERSTRSSVADQWGVTARHARSKLMETWRRERSGSAATTAVPSSTVSMQSSKPGSTAGKDKRVQPSPPQLGTQEVQQHKNVSHVTVAPSDGRPPQAPQSRVTSQSTRTATPEALSKAPPLVRSRISPPAPSPVPLETVQYLRALPQPPALAPATVEYLQEEERATLTLVAQEARREAKDWLAKRIGQKKLLSDAHAQLQSAQKHKRSASGGSTTSKDDTDTRPPRPKTEETGAVSAADVPERPGLEPIGEQQLLEEYKATAAKRFIDKHVAEAVAEARLSIEREKQTIFQETGLYPGSTSASKKNKKKDGGKPRSLLVRAASSTTGSMLLPASSASVASMSRAEGNATQLSDDSGGNASFWWSERGTTFLSDDSNLTWLSATGPRGGTMLSDSGGGGLTWLSTGRGTTLDAREDRRLSFSARSFLESEDGNNSGDGARADALLADDHVVESSGEHEHEHDGETDPEYRNPLDRPSFAQIISERKTMA